MTVLDSHEAVGGTQPGAADPGRRKGAVRRHLWLVLLAVYCLGFGLFAFVQFIGFDQTAATVTTRPDVAVHFPMLAVHVLFGSVAMCLAWLQVWPWLRENRPRTHRRIGLVYLFAGAIPSGLLAIPVAILSTSGQSYRVSLLALALLWLTTTFFGYRAVRQGRYADHRRWMLRNVALTTAIITARPFFAANFFGLSALLPETYPMSEQLTYTESLSTGMWSAVLLHLIIVEWLLLRPKRSARAELKLPAGGRK